MWESRSSWWDSRPVSGEGWWSPFEVWCPTVEESWYSGTLITWSKLRIFLISFFWFLHLFSVTQVTRQYFNFCLDSEESCADSSALSPPHHCLLYQVRSFSFTLEDAQCLTLHLWIYRCCKVGFFFMWSEHEPFVLVKVLQRTRTSGRTRRADGVIQPESEGLRMRVWLYKSCLASKGMRTKGADVRGRRRWMSQSKQKEQILPSSATFVLFGHLMDWMMSTCIDKSNLYSVHWFKC